MGYSFKLAARVLLYPPSHTRVAHTTAFVTPVIGWKDVSDDISMSFSSTNDNKLLFILIFVLKSI